VRARFLSECGWGSERSLLEALERRDRLLQQALAAGRHVALWFEHDLFDQLQLLQALALAADSPGELELIQADDFLGPLAPDGLEALWPSRRPVTADMLELARDAWDAFSAPDPTALPPLLARDTAALPFLAAAVRRSLEELPDATSGLSRMERQLLEPLRAGPSRAVELFVANQAQEEAAFAGDAWVWKRLAELVPLVEPLPAPPPLGDPRAFAAARVVLTPLGEDVLARNVDRVEATGLDRWLGGTHLGVGTDWRWDAESRALRTRP
jgi:hypothetical protein